MNEDLKQIKKKYGEAMSHLCRELFPTLLEKEGLLPKLLLEHFCESHALCEDIVKNDLIKEFKNYIYSFVEIKDSRKEEEIKTPEELLGEVGYNLYECKTEEDIQSFRKYYAPNEELCTFHGGRLNRCRVFFAIKKNVEEIKRQDFPNPERQDLYGTSVISIQFDKDETNRLSIKNRYNHTVSNPDSTFSNNLDNIVEGLTDSFEKHYGIIQKYRNNHFEIPNYVMANDGKFYKYNYEIDNTYYCPNNIIINYNGIKQYDKEKYLVFDYFILDLVNKKISCNWCIEESFIDSVGIIQKIEIKNKKEEKEIVITNTKNHSTYLTLDKENRIIGFSNAFLKEIGHHFLTRNETLQKIDLPNVEKISSHFLRENKSLIDIYLPNVKEIGGYFLRYNNTLIKMDLPNVQKIGDYFLEDNNSLISVNLPSVKQIGDNFLGDNNSLININLPKVEQIGYFFLERNNTIKTINFPNVMKIGSNFLRHNESLLEIHLPKVKEIGCNFLFRNQKLTTITSPGLETVDDFFLFRNNSLQYLYLPHIKTIGNYFLVVHPNREYLLQMLEEQKVTKEKQRIKK